jgi:hypothetical protein
MVVNSEVVGLDPGRRKFLNCEKNLMGCVSGVFRNWPHCDVRQGCQIFLGTMYQNVEKYTKCP